MKTHPDCVPCFIRQALEVARLAADDVEVQKHMLKEALELLRNMDYDRAPLETGAQIHRMINRISKNPDPYHEIKKKCNQFALKMLTGLKKRALESRDPFTAAALLAIAGNLIDFGLPQFADELKIERELEKVIKGQKPLAQMEELKKEIERAESILYIGDNAGEIVFDKFFIEFFPLEKVTFSVRGQPIINDATISDAEETGLTGLVKVIDSGSDLPGVMLDQCSKLFQEAFGRADLIISKGQGNYESLNEADKNIFFLLKAKCPVVAREIGCRLGDVVVKRQRN